MALPESARPYWQQQAAVNAAAVAVALRSWQSSGGDDAKWLAMLPLLLRVITRAQGSAVIAAAKFIEAAVADLSINTAAVAAIDPAPLIGLSGAGLPLRNLYARLPFQFRVNIANRIQQSDADEIKDLSGAMTTSPDGIVSWGGQLADLPSDLLADAMTSTGKQLTSSVHTALSDTGRAAESLEIAVRPGVGYVRMLDPPSCKRCVVLAGKFYKWNMGFERHPGCDCRHIPATEALADDITVDPARYFASLTEAEQDSTFTKAGAQAIRDGADMSQVVNADLGMKVAQVYGQKLKITTTGVTKRGIAGKALRARGRKPETTPRLMPSTIYQIADDREDALRLLRLNSYILPNSTPAVVDLDALLARSSA